ncbi:MAG: hypothetical protein AMJ73_05025 [candidate division Zixibacteria bacterium SM1_73]|nr:MAG: hypothetical protein AMJ73_05025 [candidate division Zixibacteria bacterium SM1_73]
MGKIKDMSDAELWDAFCDKPSALSRLVAKETYTRLLEGICPGIDSVSSRWNHDDYKDVTQEAMIDAFEGRHTWSRKGKLFSWAFTIGKNAARTWLRNKRKLNLVGISSTEATVKDDKLRADALLAAKRKIAQIKKELIDKAPPDVRRLVLALINEEFRSLKKAAEMLEVPRSKFYRWLNNNPARKKKFEVVLSMDKETRDAINWLHRKAKAEGKDLYGSETDVAA